VVIFAGIIGIARAAWPITQFSKFVQTLGKITHNIIDQVIDLLNKNITKGPIDLICFFFGFIDPDL
jgi:hypothetical protein